MDGFLSLDDLLHFTYEQIKSNGSSIEMAVFENEVGSGRDARTPLSISINRSYKDGEAWNDTKNMRVQDLPALALLAQKVHDLCQEEFQKQ